MSVTRSSMGVSAMSLIELLCVIAIIALLAALLLPALGQAKTRAKRIQCIDHLHQTGVGFVSFANDHNGQFPMAVPASTAGTLELARGSSLLQANPSQPVRRKPDTRVGLGKLHGRRVEGDVVPAQGRKATHQCGGRQHPGHGGRGKPQRLAVWAVADHGYRRAG